MIVAYSVHWHSFQVCLNFFLPHSITNSQLFLAERGYTYVCMTHVLLEELSSPGCHNCKAFEEYWHTIEKQYPQVEYKNVSILTPEGQALAVKHGIFASPGIVINGELFSTGGVNKDDFLKKITELLAS